MKPMGLSGTFMPDRLLMLLMSENIFLSPAVLDQNFLIVSKRFEQGRPFRPLSKIDI